MNNPDLRKLQYLLEEYEDIERELEYMVEAWESDDPCEAAVNDPGLQFEKSMELEDKYNDIKNMLSEL